jgi:hypothetical protein
MERFADPALYRKLSVPMATKEIAEEATREFFVELRELRERYGIPEVCVVVSVNFLDVERREHEMVSMLTNGNYYKAPELFGSGYRATKQNIERALKEAIEPKKEGSA